jgi:hypothetical protein
MVLLATNPKGDGYGFEASLERLCDRVATGFLVNSDLLAQEWRKMTHDGVIGFGLRLR